MFIWYLPFLCTQRRLVLRLTYILVNWKLLPLWRCFSFQRFSMYNHGLPVPCDFEVNFALMKVDVCTIFVLAFLNRKPDLLLTNQLTFPVCHLYLSSRKIHRLCRTRFCSCALISVSLTALPELLWPISWILRWSSLSRFPHIFRTSSGSCIERNAVALGNVESASLRSIKDVMWVG